MSSQNPAITQQEESLCSERNWMCRVQESTIVIKDKSESFQKVFSPKCCFDKSGYHWQTTFKCFFCGMSSQNVCQKTFFRGGRFFFFCKTSPNCHTDTSAVWPLHLHILFATRRPIVVASKDYANKILEILNWL